MNKAQELDAILVRFSSARAAMVCLADYLDDPDRYEGPVGEVIERFLDADTHVIDPTRTATLLEGVDPELATYFTSAR